MTPAKLLVIEDDSFLAFEMQDILSDAGYDVIGPAGTVAKALELIGSRDIDAAFVDCNLHGECATAIVHALTARTIPFVVVTGSEMESLPPEFSTGAFARKPFNAARLLEIAQALLHGRD